MNTTSAMQRQQSKAHQIEINRRALFIGCTDSSGPAKHSQQMPNPYCEKNAKRDLFPPWKEGNLLVVEIGRHAQLRVLGSEVLSCDNLVRKHRLRWWCGGGIEDGCQATATCQESASAIQVRSKQVFVSTQNNPAV